MFRYVGLSYEFKNICVQIRNIFTANSDSCRKCSPTPSQVYYITILHPVVHIPCEFLFSLFTFVELSFIDIRHLILVISPFQCSNYIFMLTHIHVIVFLFSPHVQMLRTVYSKI